MLFIHEVFAGEEAEKGCMWGEAAWRQDRPIQGLDVTKVLDRLMRQEMWPEAYKY